MPRPSAFFLATLLFLPSLAPSPAHGAERLAVVASIFPLYEFAREVGGDRVDVSLLIPPGSEVHSWEPRASDITRVRNASLFLYLGTFLESWVPRALDAAGVKATLAAGRGLHPEGGDPHLWLDFSLDEKMVDAIAAEFARLDPPGAGGYASNAAAFKKRLSALDASYRRAFLGCPHREFVFAGHSAFGLLAARYELTQVALTGSSPDSEPSPRAVAGAVETLRERGLKAVFFEELVNPGLAEVIAREAGAQTLALSPAHELTAAQWKERATFIDLMERNLASLRTGMGCD